MQTNPQLASRVRADMLAMDADRLRYLFMRLPQEDRDRVFARWMASTGCRRCNCCSGVQEPRSVLGNVLGGK